MMTNQTLSKLAEMRLNTMGEELVRQMELPAMAALSFEERFGLVVDAEWRSRYNAKIDRLLKSAKLRCSSACLEDIDFSAERNLDKALVARLSDMSWIADYRNLLITGPCGVGKTWIASAFGNAACRLGKRVATYRVSRLLDNLRMARSDGSWGKLLATIKKLDILILDDFGLDRLDATHSRDLMEIAEDRENSGVMIITAQLPVIEWHEVFDDKTVADATLDRIVHGSYRIELRGPSRRARFNDN
ncbi:MAG: IS21-like element helper ATPase IstB [Defluviitaleaceae bacterium]|nr:IS21-like element helper ATPase IstB [Defluviitaleaceae bacterium]